MKPCPNPDCVAVPRPLLESQEPLVWAPTGVVDWIHCPMCGIQGPVASSASEAEKLWDALPRTSVLDEIDVRLCPRIERRVEAGIAVWSWALWAVDVERDLAAGRASSLAAALGSVAKAVKEAEDFATYMRTATKEARSGGQ